GGDRSWKTTDAHQTSHRQSSAPWRAEGTVADQRRPAPGLRSGCHIGGGAGAGDLEDVLSPTHVRVRSARGAGASLGAEGFALSAGLAPLPPGLRARDEDALAEACYDEAAALVRQCTGADVAFVYGHALREGRGGVPAEEHRGALPGPVARVHCDYTAASGHQKLQRLAAQGLLPGAALRWAAGRLRAALGLAPLAPRPPRLRRFALVNVWRSLAEGRVMAWPLAVCAAGSVDLAAHAWPYVMEWSDHGAQADGTIMVLESTGSARHEWSYYPGMTSEEALMFKVFDSVEEGEPRFVFHTAFDDPTTPQGAPPRLSAEIRVLAAWE
ncbi:unnamed protein product, partial [Prorocentrum cordatum]